MCDRGHAWLSKAVLKCKIKDILRSCFTIVSSKLFPFHVTVLGAVSNKIHCDMLQLETWSKKRTKLCFISFDLWHVINLVVCNSNQGKTCTMAAFGTALSERQWVIFSYVIDEVGALKKWSKLQAFCNIELFLIRFLSTIKYYYHTNYHYRSYNL